MIKLAPPECKANVGVTPDLIFENPYATEGKCYVLGGYSSKQFFNKAQAIYFYSYASRTQYPVLVDFGDAMIPASWQAYVIGTGTFKYQTVSGALNIIPAVKIIKIIKPERELAY